MQKAVRVVVIVLAVLMLALLALQFLPYWTVADRQVSIQEYTWLPLDNKDLTKQFEGMYGKANYNLNDVVGMPVLVFFFTIGTALFTIFTKAKSWVAIFPAVAGISVIIGYLTLPIYQLNDMWIAHVALAGVIVLVSIIAIASFVKELLFKAAPKK